MYEIRKDIRNIDDVDICTYSRNISDSFNLEVEAGTGVGTDPYYGNIYCTKTYIRIENKGGDIAGNKLENLHNFSVRPYSNGVEIFIDGANGLEAITRALKFAYRVLRDGSAGENY